MAAGRPEAVDEVISDLRKNNRTRDQMKLTADGGSARQTVQQLAVEESSAEPGDTLDQWWMPEQGIVVIDMESADD